MTSRILPLAFIVCVSSALLVGCVTAVPDAGANDSAGVVLGDVLAEAGYDSSEPGELIESLDALEVSERPSDLIVSVMPTELVVQPGEIGERRIPLTGEPFYLSVAPYMNQTHPCTFHSLTTCLGEQRGQPVSVTVTDAESGAVYLDEERTTADNGFTGMWLPRDVRVHITMTIDGRTGTATASTGDDDPTCLTTLQLS